MKQLAKNYFMLIGLLGFANAQINLLHTSDGLLSHYNNVSPTCFNGYFPEGSATNPIRIYNEDFSIRAEVNIPVSDGQAVSAVVAVSEKIFVTDDKLEFLVQISGSGGGLRLFNENGNMLKDFGVGRNFWALHLTSSGDYRLIVIRSVVVENQARIISEIYSLPGRREPSVSANSARIPRSGNPVSFAGINGGRVHLNLAAGNYTVQILNPQGRLINSVNVNAVNGLNSIDLRTNELARGVFILNVERAGISILSQSITVD